jgi:Tol biopolymer transport system component
VIVARVDTGKSDKLGLGWDPSWSPDGTRIVCTGAAPAGRTELFVMNADGSNRHPLTGATGGVEVAMPSWGS